jgi:CRISPR/Cas system-associated protein Csm6
MNASKNKPTKGLQNPKITQAQLEELNKTYRDAYNRRVKDGDLPNYARLMAERERLVLYNKMPKKKIGIPILGKVPEFPAPLGDPKT